MTSSSNRPATAGSMTTMASRFFSIGPVAIVRPLLEKIRDWAVLCRIPMRGGTGSIKDRAHHVEVQHRLRFG